MDEDRNQEPSERFRSILSNDDDETNAQPPTQSQSEKLLEADSLLSKLPRLKTSPPPEPAPIPQIETVEPQKSSEPPPEPPPAPPRKGLNFGPPFWTITGILSLIVNGILILVLLILLTNLGSLQGLQGTAGNIGSSVLGGLYSNFEKMDRATIKTVIPVDAQIPLDISVPVQTTTQITLADTVSIPNAQVVINTGGLNINSNARVTLPAGTPLTVNLNFNLPVQTSIPVHLDVPVNIPMSETELHEPFIGLQQVVQPLYCLVDSDASNLNGQLICR